jgi:hypothetical protein
MTSKYIQAHYILACVLLLLSLVLHPIRAEGRERQVEGGSDDEVEANAEDFVVGVVCDTFLKYAEKDSQVCDGASWWVKWVNRQGGLRYPLEKGEFTSILLSFHSLIQTSYEHICGRCLLTSIETSTNILILIRGGWTMWNNKIKGWSMR